MTVQEFETSQGNLTCQYCQSTHLALDTEPGNNGRFIRCVTCEKRHAVLGVMWLRQSTKKRRKAYKQDDGVYDVWERNGNVCFCCGLPISMLVILGIGLERHHPWKYAKTEHEGPIIPVCKACHPYVTLRQQEAERWCARLQELHAESVSSGRPDLSNSGLSPDPLRAAGQAPAGAVEEFSDDHADA